MAEPEAKMEEGTPFVTLWVDAGGMLRYSANGVGTYTMIGWFTTMLSYLQDAALGRKRS